MKLIDLETLIKSRRTIRKWTTQEVPENIIMKAIEMATWAPNAGNSQGWRFIVINNREVINQMADAVDAVMKTIGSWPESVERKEELERLKPNTTFFRKAPVCIVVFTKQYSGFFDHVLRSRESFDAEAREMLGYRASAPNGTASTAAAVTTLMLVLHQMGLGAAWTTVPVMAKKQIESILGMTSDLSLTCLVPVGYPDQSPKKGRKSVNEVTEVVR
jgi:nitroreductase